jgi:hypothetical protein
MSIRKVISRSIQDNTVAAADFQGAVSSLSNAGNLTFSSTGQRILGDFGNSTVSNRIYLQTTITNDNTAVGVIPNGTAAISALNLVNNSDPTNSSFLQVGARAAEVSIRSSIFGTGTYLPLTMYTNNAERLRIDTSGNVAISRTTAIGTNCRLNVQLAGTSASGYTAATNAGIAMDCGTGTNGVVNLVGGGELGIYRTNTSGAYDVGIGFGTNADRILRFDTAGSERMRIDSSGNVGIGTSSPSARLNVVGGGTNALIVAGGSGSTIRNTASAGSSWFVGTNADSYILHNESNTPMLFTTNGAERMRITSDGSLLVGTTSTPVSGYNCIGESGADVQIILQRLGDGGGYGGIGGSAANAFMVYGSISGLSKRFEVNQAGSCFNQTGTYGTISDIKIKENIEDARGYLNDLRRVRIVKYSLKADQRTTPDKLGVVAQELEEIFPHMIEEVPDVVNGKEILESTTKNVKYSVFVPMLIKALQEQQDIITELKARLDAAGL